MANKVDPFKALGFEMVPVADPFSMTPEEEADYWSGVGQLTIFVTLCIPEEDIFEFEIIEASGCLGGVQESIGIDYLIREMWAFPEGLNISGVEGFEITFTNVTAHWTRGDGWTTDDDVQYDYEEITVKWEFWPWFKTKTSALWWKYIGWRFKKWL